MGTERVLEKITGISPDFTGTALGNKSLLSFHSLCLVIRIKKIKDRNDEPNKTGLLRTVLSSFLTSENVVEEISKF